MQSTFIAIAPKSSLTWSGNTYGSNRTVWHLNCVQTNDLCLIELFEIDLFYHLPLGKQMIDV